MATAMRGRSKSLVLFGKEVRRYRQAEGLSQDAVGTKVHLSGANVGQIERGEVRCHETTATALDELLDTRGALPSLWKELVLNAAFPLWFDWPKIEAEASHLKAYEGMIVYGLLQTEAYASVLLHGSEEAITARMGRQEILIRTEPAPPKVSALLPECVLYHQVGDTEVMRDQIDRLITAAEAGTAAVQIIPGRLPTAGTVGSFVVATLPDRSEVAYVDTPARGLTLDAPDDVRTLLDRYDSIREQALPVSMSVDLMRKIMEDRWT